MNKDFLNINNEYLDRNEVVVFLETLVKGSKEDSEFHKVSAEIYNYISKLPSYKLITINR